MSLILEALKKLDREKQAPDRGVLVVGPSAWPSARGGRFNAVGVVGGAVAVAGVGVMLWLLRGRAAPEAAPVRPTAAAVSSATGLAQPTPPPVGPASGPIAEPRTSDLGGGGPRVAGGGPAAAGTTATSRSAPTRSEPAAPSGSTPPDSGESAAPATAAALDSEPVATVESPPPATVPRRRGAAREFQLEAISAQDGRPVAVLNGQLFREGETIDGVRVVRIGADEVEIEVGGRRRVVKF